MRPYGIAAAALLTVASGSAAAQQLQYTFTGNDTDGTVEYASFVLDVHPVVLPNNVGLGEGFRVKFLPGVFQYGTTISYLQDIQFFNADLGGGFINLDPADKVGTSSYLVTYGAQLYTGSEAAPTMLTGRFTLFDAFSNAPLLLSVTAVPEPGTWAMLILGFGIAGFALRRRTAVRTTVTFA